MITACNSRKPYETEMQGEKEQVAYQLSFYLARLLRSADRSSVELHIGIAHGGFLWRLFWTKIRPLGFNHHVSALSRTYPAHTQLKIAGRVQDECRIGAGWRRIGAGRARAGRCGTNEGHRRTCAGQCGTSARWI